MYAFVVCSVDRIEAIFTARLLKSEIDKTAATSHTMATTKEMAVIGLTITSAVTLLIVLVFNGLSAVPGNGKANLLDDLVNLLMLSRVLFGRYLHQQYWKHF